MLGMRYYLKEEFIILLKGFVYAFHLRSVFITLCDGLVPVEVWDHMADAPPPQREWNTKPQGWDKERFNTTIQQQHNKQQQ